MSRSKHYKNAYRSALKQKIEALQESIFLRQEILPADALNREQLRLNRAFRAFIDEGFIIKIGHGLYAKARLMDFPNGEKKAVLEKDFESIAMLALHKYGIQWEFGKAIQEYNQGLSTQIPTVFTVRLKSRFRGKIVAEGREVLFEGNINAK